MAKSEVYWMCSDCGLWFQQPMPPKKFEADEEKGEDGRSKGHEQSRDDLNAAAFLAICWAKNWISRIPLKGRSKPTALDIGSKYPYFAHTLRHNFNIDAYGLDAMDIDHDQMAPGVVAPIIYQYQAELKVPMLFVDFEKVTAKQILEKTEVGERFDAISMVHVFEHIYDALAGLKLVRELINPEGYFFVRMPSNDVEGWTHHMGPRHYSIHPYFYSEKSFRYVVEKSDCFRIIETYPLPGVGARDFILKPK